MAQRDRRSFRRRVREAAADPQLRQAIERCHTAYLAARRDGMAGVDFEALREQVREIKRQAIERLPELVAQFRAEAEAVNAVVHLADDATQACRIVVNLARERGVTLAAKSKSVTTEEISLNAALQAAGVTVVETDLGEYICQLAGERPSHFVSPAMHKTREEVAALLSRALGRPVPDDIPSLVECARCALREVFVNAQMGITGANIAIADTGTLVLVTNEGNGRLVSSLPPLHVAVVGIDKVVPSLDEAATILKILARSATGQKITSYTTLITGPSRTSDIEKTTALGAHGPKELHIVLVDNGRSRLREDKALQEALLCIRCGACLYVCPPFRAVGGHAFGHIYTGGIGAIFTAFYHGGDAARDPLSLCAGCRYCVDFCPAGVDVPRLVLALRARLGAPPAKRVFLREVLKEPERLRRLAKVGARVQRPFERPAGMLEVPMLTRFRSLPQLAREPLRSRWTPGDGGERAILYPGCVVEYVYPEMAESARDALAAMGIGMALAEEAVCCGIPAIYAGDEATALALARRTIAAIERAGDGPVITLCPSCDTALTRHFPELLADDAEWRPRAEALAARAHDFSSFLASRAGPSAAGDTRVTYHDSCHLRRAAGVFEEPRALLRAAGYQVVEMEDADACCGFAGSYSFEYPEVSARILQEKLHHIEATGAPVVATDCPGCILQLRGGLHKRGSRVRVSHTAELVAARIGIAS